METIIISDLHLTEVDPVDPARPLWKAYKQKQFTFDEDFARLLAHIDASKSGPVELVLNGDIFDFDNITSFPRDNSQKVNWLARMRGLASERWMSCYKIERIIHDHPVWFDSLKQFRESGNRVVFVLGNHDVELSWPRVQDLICRRLGLPENPSPDESIDFCTWFYISNQDTYISHGHQYDPNCVVTNPITPLISINGNPRVRIPFGDLAERYMLNKMGYFNPHATENFIMEFRDYVKFFFEHVARHQPLLIWTWFWSAIATLFISLRDHWKPALQDPLMVDEQVRRIANEANATPSMVRKLERLTVPSACTNPWRIIRELWLDRAFLLIGVFYAAWQIILMINFAWPISALWVLVPLVVFLPLFFMYARTIRHTVFAQHLLDESRAGLLAEITGTQRVVFGHTHIPIKRNINSVTYLNGGTWSPAFLDPTCQKRVNEQTFVRIQPSTTHPNTREADIWIWPMHGTEPHRFSVSEA